MDHCGPDRAESDCSTWPSTAREGPDIWPTGIARGQCNTDGVCVRFLSSCFLNGLNAIAAFLD